MVEISDVEVEAFITLAIREYLQKRGVNSTGRRHDLIKRLKKASSGDMQAFQIPLHERGTQTTHTDTHRRAMGEHIQHVRERARIVD